MKSRAFIQSVFIALGGFLFGYDIAMISGTTSALESLFELSKFQLGFTVAIALVGTIIGTLIIGKPADKYGRKKVLQVAVLILLWLQEEALSQHWYMFLVFRFIQGLIVGSVSVVVPMYIAEISPAKVRGQYVMLNQFNVVTAILSAYLVNYFIAKNVEFSAWRYMIGFEVIPSLLFLLLLMKVDPSPRWLVQMGRNAEAIHVFKSLGFESPEKEAEHIRLSLQHQEEGKEASLFTGKNAFAIMVTVLIAMFNQLAGINAIIYYAPRIFEMTGLGQDTALLQSISIGLTNLIFTFAALFLIDRYGRRTLLMIGSVGMVLFLSLISRAFFLNAFDGYSVMVYLIGFIAFLLCRRVQCCGFSFPKYFPTMCVQRGRRWAVLPIG